MAHGLPMNIMALSGGEKLQERLLLAAIKQVVCCVMLVGS
jgi:hypothetical protein